MSIDARVVGIRKILKEPFCKLLLEDRPGGGLAGQETLRIVNVEEIRRPYWLLTLKQLVGLDIWGGAGQIMLGEEKLADRFGYVDIALTDDWDSVIEQHVSSNQEKET